MNEQLQRCSVPDLHLVKLRSFIRTDMLFLYTTSVFMFVEIVANVSEIMI